MLRCLVVGLALLVFDANQAMASWIDGSKAQLQALDKITARISTLTATIGMPIRFGTLEITVQRCAFRPPEEPPENVAFLEVYDQGHDASLPRRRVFFRMGFFIQPGSVGAGTPGV